MERKKRILIVDDDRQIRFLLATFLKDDGVEIDCASDGEEALSLISKKHYDLLITDYNMPKMTGSDLLKIVKTRYSLKHAIGITSETHEHDLYKAGAEACIYKPFTLREVKSVIDQFL